MYSRGDKYGSMHMWDNWGFARKLHVRVLLHVKGDDVGVVTTIYRDVWYKIQSKIDCVINLSERSTSQFTTFRNYRLLNIFGFTYFTYSL